jgi:peptidoglycan-associated lipoprotein
MFLLAVGGCGKKQAPEPETDVTAPPAEETVVEEPIDETAEAEVDATPLPDYGAMDPSEYGIEDVFFAFDKYDLSPEAMTTLSISARLLRDEATDVIILIEGHCDERGTVEYNLALGERRALAVRDYLVSLGVPEYRLRVTSYGESRPFAYGSNESAWALNRRAHFARP